MIKIFRVLQYIWVNNRLWRIPKVLIQSITYQAYKRLTGGIISKRIFTGGKVFLFPDCPISTMFLYTDIPDKDEISALRDLVNDNTVFLDIGSNIGSYSIMMADIVQSVYAFEPHPFTAKRCKMNFLLNNLDEKNVIELALTDRTGIGNFTDVGGSSPVNSLTSSQFGTIKVKTDRLDNVVHSNGFSDSSSYLVKIDVEGMEENVLRSGEQFFTNFDVRGIIVESFGNKIELVHDVLRRYGFHVKQLSKNNYLAVKNTFA